MDNNTATILALFLLLGWIPILAVGNTLANIVRAFKAKTVLYCDNCDEYFDKENE